MRRHFNRNFVNPVALSASSFEQMDKALNIFPEECRSSPELKDWVRRNTDQRYLPVALKSPLGDIWHDVGLHLRIAGAVRMGLTHSHLQLS